MKWLLQMLLIFESEKQMIKYHYTLPSNIDSILNHGLIRSFSNFWKGNGGCIYLMDDIPYDKSEMAIFSVRINELDVTRLSDWELVCWEDIKPDRLSLVLWKYDEVKCSKCGKESVSVHAIPMKYPCECFHCGTMACYIKES